MVLYPNACEKVVLNHDIELPADDATTSLRVDDSAPWYQKLFDVTGCPVLTNPPPVLSDRCLAASLKQIAADSDKAREFIVVEEDEMLYDAFIDYATNQSSELLVVGLVILAVVLGCYGNGYLHFLFSRRKSDWYRGLDSQYFRELATLDLIVCAVILPYCVFYKLRLVTNDAACRLLELFRHALTYAAHILLMTYIFWINRLSGNRRSRIVSLTTVCVACLSLVLAIPAAILFSSGDRQEAVRRKLDKCEAHDVTELLMCVPEESIRMKIPSTLKNFQEVDYNRYPFDQLTRKIGIIFHEDNMKILFSPDYCHMNFGFHDDEFLDITAQLYMYINVTLYVLAAGSLFWQIMPWLVNTSTFDVDKDIFYKFDSSESEESEYSVSLSDLTKCGASTSSRPSTSPTANNAQPTESSGTSDSSLSSDTSDSDPSGGGRGDDNTTKVKWAKLRGLVKGKRAERMESMAVWPWPKKAVSQVCPESSTSTRTQSNATLKENTKSESNDVPKFWKSKYKWWKILTLPIIKKSKSPALPEAISFDIERLDSETTESDTDTSTDDDETEQEPPATESYKTQWIGFIVVDLLLVAACGVLYMMDTETADVMILIHTKSVISFYFFVIFHRQLRDRVCPWIRPCFRRCVDRMGRMSRTCPCLRRAEKAAKLQEIESGKVGLRGESGQETEGEGRGRSRHFYFFVIFHRQLRDRVCPWVRPLFRRCVDRMGRMSRTCPCLRRAEKAAKLQEIESGKVGLCGESGQETEGEGRGRSRQSSNFTKLSSDITVTSHSSRGTSKCSTLHNRGKMLKDVSVSTSSWSTSAKTSVKSGDI